MIKKKEKTDEEKVVAELKVLLARAKRGELIGLAYVARDKTNQTKNIVGWYGYDTVGMLHSQIAQISWVLK